MLAPICKREKKWHLQPWFLSIRGISPSSRWGWRQTPFPGHCPLRQAAKRVAPGLRVIPGAPEHALVNFSSQQGQMFPNLWSKQKYVVTAQVKSPLKVCDLTDQVSSFNSQAVMKWSKRPENLTKKGEFSPYASSISGCSPRGDVGCLLALAGRCNLLIGFLL